MTECHHPHGRHLDNCDCVISGGTLKIVRQRRMVSLEAVAGSTDYTREYLAALERGGDGMCVDTQVILAYEKAMDTNLGAELLTFVGELLDAASAAHEMLTQLY